jgi:hypothetical protein
MKKLNIFLILISIITLSFVTHGLTRTESALRSETLTNSIKAERLQLEKETEVKLIEMIEESRLREEEARMKKVDTLNFSILKSEEKDSDQTQTF